MEARYRAGPDNIDKKFRDIHTGKKMKSGRTVVAGF